MVRIWWDDRLSSSMVYSCVKLSISSKIVVSGIAEIINSLLSSFASH